MIPIQSAGARSNREPIPVLQSHPSQKRGCTHKREGKKSNTISTKLTIKKNVCWVTQFESRSKTPRNAKDASRIQAKMKIGDSSISFRPNFQFRPRHLILTNIQHQTLPAATHYAEPWYIHLPDHTYSLFKAKQRP
jgi:hypothetical protein